MTVTFPLTTEDIAALRSADSIVFQYYKGCGSIRAILRRWGEPVYTKTQQRLFPNSDTMDREREICTDTNMFDYGVRDGSQGWNSGSEPNAYGFHMIHSAKFNASWTTIAALLRKGDVITLQWAANNDTDAQHEHGVVTDDLHLVIQRGDKRMTFFITSQTGPDNSARLVQRYGR
jgi:hypothetical protein